MPVNRVEEASTGRAGCKNKECQENKEKIQKGELRFGTWVETEQFQSWAWKHWGCVTPKQISGMRDALDSEDPEDPDLSQLDGYEELSEENQAKVREAVVQGHVADSEWRGDVEMNRPGKTGFRVRGSKKKADAEAKSEKKDDKPAKRSAKRAAESEDEEKPPAPKKAKGATSKKAKAEDQQNGEDKPKASKGGKAKPKTGKTAKDTKTSAETKDTAPEKQKVSRAQRAADREAKKSSA